MSDTEHTQTTEPTTEPAEAPEAGAEDTQAAQEGEGGNKEAAKYRRRLRETEGERDTLRAQVEALQRAAVEQAAGKHLRKPAGLWASGVTPAELVDDSGNVDPEKVEAAARAAADSLGLARTVGGNYSPREGNNPRPSSGTPRFEDALLQG